MNPLLELLISHVLVVAGVLAVALAMILALQQRRPPQSSAAWILFIIALPYVAVPVFLILGFRKTGRRVPRLHFSPSAATDTTTAPGALQFCALGAPAPVLGNRITLHAEPEAARASLARLIEGAEQRIDILLYVLAKDESGRAFVEALTRKAREGVKVRLMLDWLGTLHRPRHELHAFVQAGGELRFASPLDRLGDSRQINLRNHRKLVLVDGARIWSGGRNVGNEYLASPPGEWLDLSFEAEGPLSHGFAEIFASDWVNAGRHWGRKKPELPVEPRLPTIAPQPHPGQAVLQLLPAGPDEPQDILHDGLVNAIHRANTRIWLATPYFVPTDSLVLALASAARRGVDLRLCLPDRSNQWTTDLARGGYLRSLDRAGGRVLRYLPGMMHAKAGVIDDMAFVGSANLDVRSMLLNFEVSVMAHDAPTVAALAEWFAGLEPWCEEGTRPAGPARRILESIFRLGAPIL